MGSGGIMVKNVGERWGMVGYGIEWFGGVRNGGERWGVVGMVGNGPNAIRNDEQY